MTGFHISVVEDNNTRVYPLFCHSSDWCNGVKNEDEYRKVVLNYTLAGSIQLDFLEDKVDKYYTFFELLNKKLSYDIDVSCVKKNFNFAFYSSALTQWDYYKDAQSTDSRTEIDFMECNRTAYHFTAHKAYDRNGGLIMGTGGTIQQYNPDDLFMCTESIDRNELYGPGKYIDTGLPIHVEITFREDNIHIDLSQNGKNIYKDVG